MIDYKFYINPSLVELKPIYTNCTFKGERQGNIIFRYKIDGDLIFNGADFDILDAVKATANYQDVFIDEIIAGVTNRFAARINFGDESDWNPYSKNCKLKVDNIDKYSNLFDNKSLNIKSNFPVYESNTKCYNVVIENKTNDHLCHSIDVIEWLTKCFNAIDVTILIDASTFPTWPVDRDSYFTYLNICPLSSYIDFNDSSKWHKDIDLRLELQKVLDYLLFFFGYDYYLSDTNYLRFVQYPNYFGAATQNLSAYERQVPYKLSKFTHKQKTLSCAGESLSNDFKLVNYRYELTGEIEPKPVNTDFLLDFKAIKANDTLLDNPVLVKSGFYLAHTTNKVGGYTLTAVVPAQTETTIKAPDAYNLTGSHCWFERTIPDTKIYCGVQWTYSLNEGEELLISLLNITNTSGANVRLQIVDDLNPATILAETTVLNGNATVNWLFAGGNTQYSGAANLFFRVLMEGTPTGKVEFDVEYVYHLYRELKKFNSYPYYENNHNGALALSQSWQYFYDEPISNPWLNDKVQVTSPANSILPRSGLTISKPILSSILDHKHNEYIITSYSNKSILKSVSRGMSSGKETIEIIY
jgi:hypothetical protein